MNDKNVAFDFGYGNCKAMDNEGNQVIFPTLMKPYKKKIEQDTSDFKHISTVNKKTFAVGEFASIGSIERKNDREQQLDFEKIPVFLGTALNLLSNETSYVPQHINLSVGLPIDFFEEQRGELENILTGLEIETEINGMSKSFIIDRATILQQGVGAFLSLFLNSDGTLKEEECIDTNFASFGGGLIDVGFNTLDYARIVKQGKFILSDEDSGSLEGMGITYAHNKTADNINEYLNSNFDIITLENAMKYHDGNLFVAGKGEVNIKDFFEDGYRALANETKTKLLKIWKDINNFGVLYLTGGGAEKIAPYFKIKGIDVKVQNNSIFANCEGYLAKLGKDLK